VPVTAAGRGGELQVDGEPDLAQRRGHGACIVDPKNSSYPGAGSVGGGVGRPI
jgi:hypothetical protein